MGAGGQRWERNVGEEGKEKRMRREGMEDTILGRRSHISHLLALLSHANLGVPKIDVFLDDGVPRIRDAGEYVQLRLRDVLAIAVSGVCATHEDGF